MNTEHGLLKIIELKLLQHMPHKANGIIYTHVSIRRIVNKPLKNYKPIWHNIRKTRHTKKKNNQTEDVGVEIERTAVTHTIVEAENWVLKVTHAISVWNMFQRRKQYLKVNKI